MNTKEILFMSWIVYFILGTVFISTDLFFPDTILNFLPDCIGFFFFALGIKQLEKKTEAINYEMSKVLGMVLIILTISDIFNLTGFMSYETAPSICLVTVPDIFNYKEYMTDVDRFNPLFYVLLFLKIFITVFMCGFFYNLYKAFSSTNKKKDTPWFDIVLRINYAVFIIFQLMLIINFVFPGIKYVIIAAYVSVIIFFFISIFIYIIVNDFIKKRKYA